MWQVCYYFCIEHNGTFSSSKTSRAKLALALPLREKVRFDERNKTYNIVEYIVTCVSEFSDRFRLSTAQAYAYLRRYNAIAFLAECYDAEHTLSIEDAVEDMKDICLRNGGKIQ